MFLSYFSVSMSFVKLILAIATAYFATYIFNIFGLDEEYVKDQVSGKNVLITGASSGIGEQLAYQYAQLGANVFITARRGSLLQQVVSKCQTIAPSGKHSFTTADMTDPIQASTVVPKAIEFFRHLDVLVLNHAYIGEIGLWHGTPENITNLRKVMEGVFTSYVLLTSDAMPYLQLKNGSIAVVSSITGVMPFIMNSAYSAAKHAVEGFFRTLRTELAYRNVNVPISIFILGGTDTPTEAYDEAAICRHAGKPSRCVTSTPWLALAQPDDIAKEIVSSTAYCEYDIWLPSHQHNWLMKVLHLVLPQTIENSFTNLFLKG